MSAVDDFIANLRKNRFSADSAPMIGDIDLFIAALEQLAASGGATSPGGPDNSIQFNDTGAFGGNANFTYDGIALFYQNNGVDMNINGFFDLTTANNFISLQSLNDIITLFGNPSVQITATNLDLRIDNFLFDGALGVGLLLVGDLPTPSGGGLAIVTDANTPIAGSVVVGGGGTTVPVYFDGTDWRSILTI